MHPKTLLSMLCLFGSENTNGNSSAFLQSEDNFILEVFSSAFANLFGTLFQWKPDSSELFLQTGAAENYDKSTSPKAGRLTARSPTNGQQQQDISTVPRDKISPFDAVRLPDIDVQSYLFRLIKYSGCSRNCLLVSVIYLDRLITRRQFVLSTKNFHRLLIASLVVAIKLYEDGIYNNTYYAHVGGIPLRELNRLELELLLLLDFDLFIGEALFESYRIPFERYLLKLLQSDQPASSKAEYDTQRTIVVSHKLRRCKSSTDHQLFSASPAKSTRQYSRSLSVLQLT